MAEEYRHHHSHHHTFASEEGARHSSGHSSSHRHHHHRDGQRSGGRGNVMLFDSLAVLTSVLGVVIVVSAHIAAEMKETRPSVTMMVLAGVVIGVSLFLGVMGLAVQKRYCSGKTRRRLLVSFTLSLLVLIVVAADYSQRVDRKRIPVRTEEPVKRMMPKEREPLVKETPVDRSLYKPGWYGEVTQENVTAVLVSYAENAEEARKFQRRIPEKVSYAELMVMNLSRTEPLVVDSVQIHARLRDGREVVSSDVLPLLAGAAADRDGLTALLTCPQSLAPGKMLVSIPVCFPPDFSWKEVQAVFFSVNGDSLTIAGRMMTAAERRALVETPAAKESQPVPDTASPIDYYNNL